MPSQKGTVIPGLGKASTECLPRQAPYFAAYGISNFHNGTINVQLDGPLQIVPTITTNPIQWYPNAAPEIFSFKEVKIKYWESGPGAGIVGRGTLETVGISNGQFVTVDAWVYDPHNSPNRNKPNHLELITQTRLPIAYGSFVEVIV